MNACQLELQQIRSGLLLSQEEDTTTCSHEHCLHLMFPGSLACAFHLVSMVSEIIRQLIIICCPTVWC